MKKIICVLLLLACLFSLAGCAEAPEIPENAVTVYYRRNDVTYGTADGVIAPGYLDAAEHENDYFYLINQYLKTQPNAEFATTFPLGLTLVSFRLEALTAKVVVSNRMAAFSGLDLAIACTCLTETVMSLTGCQEVIISAESTTLGGKNFITLSKDSYLLIDSSGAAVES